MKITGFIICWSFSLLLSAQLVIKPIQSESNTNRGARTTATTTTNNALPVQLPFRPLWDDFSISSNTVDSVRVWGTDSILQWDLNESRGVFVNATLAINPPTYNVATFDGLDENGGFYNSDVNATAGDTDRLVSYPMNLAGAPGVFISFYWQAGGNVDLPEGEDFLQLKLEDLTTNRDTVLWQQNGGEELAPDGTNETTFTQEVKRIPDEFLTDSVRIVFSSFGDPDGPFDAWHLDWIYLNSNRSATDKINGYRDGALTDQLTSPFFPFQSIPVNQFTADNKFVRNQEIGVRNLSQIPIGSGQNSIFNTLMTYSLVISNNGSIIVNDEKRQYSALGLDNDPTNADTVNSSVIETLMVFGGENTSNPDRLLQNENFAQALAFDSVVLNTEIFLEEDEQNTILNLSPIDLTINDTVRQDYLLHNYYAYDDGTAEFAAGTNINNGQIAVQFWVEQPDTLTHIDINFPNISPSQNAKAINLNVYKRLDTNDLLRSQQVSVSNNITRNAFTRYALTRPVVVSDTFFIGYEQFVNDFLAVGFDRSNPDASPYIFENRSGEWVQNVSLSGAMMIRPVFVDGVEVILSEEVQETKKFKVFPNPTSGTIQIEGRYDKVELLDLSGRVLFQENAIGIHKISGFGSGLYLLRIYHADQQTETSKLILK